MAGIGKADNSGIMGDRETEKFRKAKKERYGRMAKSVKKIMIGSAGEVDPGFEWVLKGEGYATEMVDGERCAIIDGVYYKGSGDLNSGVWDEVDFADPKDRWFVNAYDNTPWCVEDGLYEAVGVHFKGNPYGLDDDFLERHGRIRIRHLPRSYSGIKEYFRTHNVMGIVFWKDGDKRCYVLRTDYGFDWGK